MKSNQKLKQIAVAVSLSLASASAFATNGYFPHGMGVKAKGMGGAAVAMTQDAFAGANNPAAAAFVGNRWDLGVDFFMPDRSATVGATSVKSSERTFPIPEFGYNVGLSDKLGVGVTVYGYGGMNTTYRTNLFGGTGDLGVDLMQLTIAPTAAYKVSPNTAVGISPLLVYQRFEATGLQPFQQLSGNPTNLTNRSYDSSTGVGVRLGVLSELSEAISLGASYSPKTNMSKFEKYAGLFASGGDFDLPSNWTIGAAVKVNPSVIVAIDYGAINYEDVNSVSNSSLSTPMSQGTIPLGSDLGSGFGWKNINVLKLGVQWQITDKTTLRAGYNKGDNPISAQDVTFNVLAPGVMEEHYTLGGTYKLSNNSEWSWFGMYAPSVKVSGSFLFNPLAPNTIEMKQYSFGLQYSKQF
jgi:long-chain fatty acid transport protein